MRGKQGTSAYRLGQQQHIAGLHAALAQHAGHLALIVHVHQAVYCKAQCQLRAFAAVPADQRASRRIEHLDRALHHLAQGGFHLPV